MRLPKRVMCELEGSGDNFICQVDENGWCRCGDSVVNEDGEVCTWANEVLEWQDIEPAYLKGKPR
ncbi:MAG: hypothetical protein PHE50_03200 [Dehalococcoidales bacterium]|nr:hypothetical protein [Dehalococcoidales bacterium]